MGVPYAEVIGDPIANSKSPLIHNFWLKKLGMEGDYRATLVTADQLPAYLQERQWDLDWRGCNVTMPHKQAVLPLLDRNADEIRAVNSIVVRDEELVGYNKDVSGFLEPLAPFLALGQRNRIARVIGAGGAGLAIASALADQHFSLVAFNRDPSKVPEIFYRWDEDLNLPLSSLAEPCSTDWGSRPDCLDLLVNASPLGMEGYPPLEVDFSNIPPGSVVYDIVTSPLETPLLAEARSRGMPVIDGLQMLISQAAAAFDLFFGYSAPREYDAELRKLLAR